MSKKKSVQKEQVPDLKNQRITHFLPFMILSFAAVLTILAYIRSLNGPLVLDDSIFIDSERLNHMLDLGKVTEAKEYLLKAYALNKNKGEIGSNK